MLEVIQDDLNQNLDDVLDTLIPELGYPPNKSDIAKVKQRLNITADLEHELNGIYLEGVKVDDIIEAIIHLERLDVLDPHFDKDFKGLGEPFNVVDEKNLIDTVYRLTTSLLRKKDKNSGYLLSDLDGTMFSTEFLFNVAQYAMLAAVFRVNVFDPVIARHYAQAQPGMRHADFPFRAFVHGHKRQIDDDLVYIMGFDALRLMGFANVTEKYRNFMNALMPDRIAIKLTEYKRGEFNNELNGVEELLIGEQLEQFKEMRGGILTELVADKYNDDDGELNKFYSKLNDSDSIKIKKAISDAVMKVNGEIFDHVYMKIITQEYYHVLEKLRDAIMWKIIENKGEFNAYDKYDQIIKYFFDLGAEVSIVTSSQRRRAELLISRVTDIFKKSSGTIDLFTRESIIFNRNKALLFNAPLQLIYSLANLTADRSEIVKKFGFEPKPEDVINARKALAMTFILEDEENKAQEAIDSALVGTDKSFMFLSWHVPVENIVVVNSRLMNSKGMDEDIRMGEDCVYARNHAVAYEYIKRRKAYLDELDLNDQLVLGSLMSMSQRAILNQLLASKKYY